MLRWAAASNDSWEKLRFLKRYLSCLTAVEAKDASLINLHVKRRKQKDKGKATGPVSGPASVVSPVKVAEPESIPLSTWWANWESNNYKDVIAMDIEKVSVNQENCKYPQ